jgi:hypothetical protein
MLSHRYGTQSITKGFPRLWSALFGSTTAVTIAVESGLLHPNQPTFAMRASKSRWCQSTKSLSDSGEVRLILSIIPRGEIVGSGGSTLS